MKSLLSLFLLSGWMDGVGGAERFFKDVNQLSRVKWRTSWWWVGYGNA